MAMAAVYVLHRRHRQPHGFERGISNNKIREVIVETNLVISTR
jgi:hypothetical protein